ncbi:MAG TPA: hypothetical protein VKB49_20530 [Candidatus Sulfotelmatobacter sp.]|nr:hypothetical protein [Candidatus Sulfotelmatobacter sp.]
MTWIKTVPLSEANENLLRALESQRPLYPKEYASPVFRADDELAGIVASHSLIPDALNHAFSTFWRVDVAGPAAYPPSTRDDHHDGLGYEPMLLLNRISRRVSA